MADSEREGPKSPPNCPVCDTYDFSGTWKCDCGAINVSKNKECWKCRASCKPIQ